jgi:hypothetical protein
MRLDETSRDRPAIDSIVLRLDLYLYKRNQHLLIVDERRPGSVRSKYISGGGIEEGRNAGLDAKCKDTDTHKKSECLHMNNLPHNSFHCISRADST